MPEINIQQVTDIPQTDATSDVAGGADVSAAYIASDVQTAPDVNASIGIDSVAVSSGVSTSQVGVGGAVEQEESSNYIQSDVETASQSGQLEYDMNSLAKINDSYKYIDPTASGIQSILANLYANGTINSGMSEEEVVLAINTYVFSNYSYIADTGDTWNSVSQTIKNGGGDCEDFANLAASLMTAALLDRGLSQEEINKKIDCVVVADPNTGLGHVYVQYTGDDGSIKYLDPVSARVTTSIDSSKVVLFSYSDENVDVIDENFDFSRLDTASYTIPADTATYIQVLPGEFQNYWESLLGMEDSAAHDNAIGIYQSLQDLINAVNAKYGSWDNGVTTTADLDTINAFLAKLDSNYIQDYDTVVKPFQDQYEAILTKLGVDTSPYNPDATAYSTAMLNYFTTMNTYIFAYCWHTTTYKEWSQSGKTMNGVSDDLIAIEYLKNGISTLEDFKAKHHDQIIETAADPTKGTAEVDWSNDYIYDNIYFKNPNGGNVCTVRQGLAAIQAYVSYVDATKTWNFMSLAYPGEARVAKYCGYADKYHTSFKTTNDYLASITSFLEQAEYGVGVLDKDLEELDSAIDVINADATVTDDQTNYNSADAKFNNCTDAAANDAVNLYWNGEADYLTSGNPDNSLLQVTDEKTRNANLEALYKQASSYDQGQMYAGSNQADVEAALEYYVEFKTADKALTEAKTTQATLRADFKAMYKNADGSEMSDADLDNVLNDYQSEYMSKDTDPSSTTYGYWEINQDASLFTEKIKEASMLKGYLTGISLIYEARRDLRKLVEEELEGEGDDYKAMEINKLFMKKVNKLTEYIQQTIVDVLSAINSLDQAKYDQDVSDINTKYDKKAEEIKKNDALKWYQFCEDDNTQEDLLKNDDARYGEINAADDKFKAVKEKQLNIVKHLLSETGMTVSGTTGDEIWASINKQINTSLDNMDNYSRATLNTSDDSQYREVDRNLVSSERASLLGVFGIQRMILIARQAGSDMRNLVHQEMTGIGGRQSRTDVAADMVSADSNMVMTWFDEAVSDIETITNLGNQIRYNEIQIEKNQKLIEKIDSQKSKRLWGHIFEALAFVAAVVAIWVPIVAVVAIAFGVVSAVLKASANKAVADEKAKLEKDYSYQVIKPTDPVFEKKLNAMSGLTDEQKKEILQNYDPNSTTFKGNLDKVSGLSAEQKDEILNAADPSRAAYEKTINADTSLTEKQKEALINAYDPNEEIFKKNLANLNASTSAPWYEFWKSDTPGLGLSDSQITMITDAYEGNTFMLSIDSSTILTEAQKKEIRNAYDKDRVTFESNLDSLGLSDDQISAVMKAYDEQTDNSANDKNYSDDNIINTALNSDNSTQDILWNMNDANYLSFMNDGHAGSYAGSSAFNTVKFASTLENIKANDLIVMVAESCRETMAEMRNLVHEEMTSIGGRSPSSMVTATMEAARGQEAFIANEMYMKLWDMNTSNNQRFERDQKLRLYQQMADEADVTFGLSFIPIVGGPVGDFYSNLSGMKDQRNQLEETSNEKFDANPDLEEADLNALVEDGLINTGNDTKGVNYEKVSNARTAVAKEFIKESVEATIKKTLHELRSIAHMEMTNIQSSTGTDFASQANIVNFTSALETISLVTQYLTQKAEIMNRVTEANQSISKLNKQITNYEIGGGIALAVAIVVSVFMPGGFDSVLAALDTLQLASSVGSFVLGVFSTINAWIEAKFAAQLAKDDMGDVAEYLEIQDMNNENIDSTQNRLEALEQNSINEINASLLQDLGSGYIGVNKALSSEFKTLIEQLYRAERSQSEIQQTLEALRNTVHEAMTGISGVSSNATMSILDMKEKAIKAKIDDMFSKLEEVATRWNQISDAQRAAEKARMQAWTTTLSTIIQGIIIAISLYSAFGKEPAAKDKVDAAQNDVDSAQTPDELDAAEGELRDAQADYQALQSRVALYTNVCLPAAEILIKLAMAFIEKDEMQGVQKTREEEVSNAGVTKVTKDAGETVKEGVAGAGLNGFAARGQAVAGQREVDNQAATYALKSDEIEDDFRTNLYNVEMDTVDYAKGLTKELARMWKNRRTEAYQNTQSFAKQLESMKLSKAQMDALNQAFKSDSAEEFLKQLASINGLSDAQVNAIEQAYDNCKHVSALGSFKERMDASAAVGKLDPAQKKAVIDAANSSTSVKDFAKKLNAIQGLSSTQKDALINAFDPKMKTFADKIDASLTLNNDDKKSAVKNAYDPNVKTCINNVLAISSLTDAEKLTALQAIDPKISSFIDNMGPAVTDTQKLSIMKQFDPNEVAFKKNVDSMDDITPVQKKDVMKAFHMAVIDNKDIKNLTDADKIKSIQGLNPAMKHKMVKAVYDAQHKVSQAKDLINQAKQLPSINQVTGAGTQAQSQAISTPPVAPQGKQSANTSNTQAMLDKLLSSFDKNMQELNGLQSQVDKLNAQTTEKLDPKELLKILQQQLKDAGAKIANEKKLIDTMKQEVAKTQTALATQEQNVQEERDKLVKAIKKVDDQIKKLGELAARSPENKKVIENQLNQLNDQLEEMMTLYKSTQEMYGIALGTEKALENEIKDKEGKVEILKAEVVKIKADINNIQKEILAKKAGGDNKNTASINIQTPKITSETPMFSTGAPTAPKKQYAYTA